MKVAFICSRLDLNLGSVRIHIYDLCYYFNQIGISAFINPPQINNFNIIIYSKNITPTKKIMGKKIGMITPTSTDIKLLKLLDFIIVGSIEERESLLAYNSNCFLFPQIERLFRNCIHKKHTYQPKIIVGYHGNSNHLNHLSLGLDKVLEKINKIHPIKLLVIGKDFENWIQGRPNIEIEFRKWDYQTAKSDIQEFDIGIVPNISDFSLSQNNSNNIILGKYDSDISLRFKNKSNIGRVLVLAQLGIPIVADITPSNMHLLANPDNGYAVLSMGGWYQAILELLDVDRRNFISNNAYQETKRLYDPLIWCRRLAKSLRFLFSN
jgi:hypothetical protein